MKHDCLLSFFLQWFHLQCKIAGYSCVCQKHSGVCLLSMWLHHKSADKKTVSDRKTGQKRKTKIRWKGESFIPVSLIWEIKTFNYFIWRSNRKSPLKNVLFRHSMGLSVHKMETEDSVFIIDINIDCHNYRLRRRAF